MIPDNFGYKQQEEVNNPVLKPNSQQVDNNKSKYNQGCTLCQQVPAHQQILMQQQVPMQSYVGTQNQQSQSGNRIIPGGPVNYSLPEGLIKQINSGSLDSSNRVYYVISNPISPNITYVVDS